MNTITSNEKERTIFKGLEALDVEQGTILKVTNKINLGDYIIKTNSHELPFTTLNNGVTWGRHISEYTFELVNYPIILTPQN